MTRFAAWIALIICTATLTAQTTYRNPVIFADYSDPDVVRVGDDFYLVASSFNAAPGLPILHSRDLVHWSIIGHAAPRLPSPRYDVPQHGNGMWAPSLRVHGGRFWIYVGDPDLGIFMTTASDPRGPWEPLTLVAEAKGWIDPCPLWDDDGAMYLVHAWAKSRAGFNGVLSVRRLSPDGRSIVVDDRTGRGTVVFEGGTKHPTIEGPKFYKRNGFYYIFAPAGGVATGWQTVLRASRVFGPYEDRIVMAQGASATNGPHQGAWVSLGNGDDWFLHFQDRGVYGRIVHLQPMQWRDNWPVIGADDDGDGTGMPVTTHRAPALAPDPSSVIQMSDDFTAPSLGLQWQWQANPQPAWASLSARPGALRLTPQAAPAGAANLWMTPHLLLQKFPAETFVVTAEVDPRRASAASSLSVIAFGLDYAAIRLQRSARGWRLSPVTCRNAAAGTPESIGPSAEVSISEAGHLWLRMTVGTNGTTRFSYSADNRSYTDLGDPFVVTKSAWVGAKFGVGASGAGTDAFDVLGVTVSVPDGGR